MARLPCSQVSTSDGRVRIIGAKGVERSLRSDSATPQRTRQLAFLLNRGVIYRVTQVGAPTDHGRLLPRHDGLLHRPRKLACSCHAAAAAGRRLLGVLASVVLGALQPLLHTPGPKPGAAVCRMAGWSCGRWTTQAPGMTTRVPRCARWSWRAAMPFCERRPWGCPGGEGGSLPALLHSPWLCRREGGRAAALGYTGGPPGGEPWATHE